MTVFHLPDDKPQAMTPEKLEISKLGMHIGVLAKEIDDMNVYFKTVNSVVLALAQYVKIPPSKMAEIMADPTKVRNYESDVVTALKLLSTKRADEINKIKNKSTKK